MGKGRRTGAAKRPATRPAKKSAPRGRKRARKRAPKEAAASPTRFAVRALDPARKCGSGTTVQLLFRLDEREDGGRTRTHLVFFDRHGWYCEHGRECLAVRHAQREARRLGFTP